LAKNKIAKIEEKMLSVEQIFFFLQAVQETDDVDSWPEVLHLLKHGDDLMSMEAEQVLKEFLISGKFDQERVTKELIENELHDFSNKVAKAISDSDLLELDDD
jgi:hypothetical protein